MGAAAAPERTLGSRNTRTAGTKEKAGASLQDGSPTRPSHRARDEPRPHKWGTGPETHPTAECRRHVSRKSDCVSRRFMLWMSGTRPTSCRGFHPPAFSTRPPPRGSNHAASSAARLRPPLGRLRFRTTRRRSATSRPSTSSRPRSPATSRSSTTTTSSMSAAPARTRPVDRQRAEVGDPRFMEAGADLVLLHPDGKEEVLVPVAGNESIADPYVSFDGKSVFFAKFHDVKTHKGSDLYRIHVPTRKITQLTSQDVDAEHRNRRLVEDADPIVGRAQPRPLSRPRRQARLRQRIRNAFQGDQPRLRPERPRPPAAPHHGRRRQEHRGSSAI